MRHLVVECGLMCFGVLVVVLFLFDYVCSFQSVRIFNYAIFEFHIICSSHDNR